MRIHKIKTHHFKLVVLLLLLHLGIQAAAQHCASLKAEARITHASCGMNNDGAVYLDIRGGTAPYSYSWNNGSKLKDLTGVAPGAYEVTVTDQQGCTTRQKFMIEAAAPFTVSYSANPPSSRQDSNGRIELQVNGGQLPYQFFVSDYSDLGNIKRYTVSKSNLSGLSAGNYLIDVRDASGCTATVAINLSSDNR